MLLNILLLFHVIHHLTNRRIRDNRDKLIELGLTTPDQPLDCYQTREWLEHTAAYDLCKFLYSNVERDVFKFIDVFLFLRPELNVTRSIT